MIKSNARSWLWLLSACECVNEHGPRVVHVLCNWVPREGLGRGERA